MVGYSEDVINDFAVKVDAITQLRSVSQMKATGTFYKLMLGTKDEIIEFAPEIVSIILAMALASKSSIGRFYGKPFQEIAKKAIIPRLNRGLYGQQSIVNLLRTDSPDEKINILGAAAISVDDPERAIALIMILVGKDLEELLISDRDIKELLVDKKLLSKTFISIEDIRNAL